jgi:hypothetical protein
MRNTRVDAMVLARIRELKVAKGGRAVRSAKRRSLRRRRKRNR